MSDHASNVVITGIGIVSCQGIGATAHRDLLTATSSPPTIVETEKFTPYVIHPMPEIDWSDQIPRRGDQRQMENWQRLGVFTAGLALDDAGLKEDAEACASMDMIVAAGGGERDIAVDSMIVEEAENRNDTDLLLNEKLTTELRPTLFLAQLSNLLAGNISIVHKVTGSSRTFMGEEAAGISALETSFARIRSRQSTHALVGGAFVAERWDMLLSTEGLQILGREEWSPLWARSTTPGGGVMLGSCAAFLVLEQKERALARGARIYAELCGVEGDRGDRANGKLASRLETMAARLPVENANTVIFSGATGIPELAAIERQTLSSLYPATPVRGFGGILGHGVEACFPIGTALAAISLHAQADVPNFDKSETNLGGPAHQAIVTTIGQQRGEGLACLRTLDEGSA